jgi:anionic cell wall polymer biosynthesis LytR-Cps2A-Psr (LCP) family protein
VSVERSNPRRSRRTKPAGGNHVQMCLVAAILVVATVWCTIGRAATDQAILLLVSDALPRSDRAASIRNEELRVDTILIVRADRRCEALSFTLVSRNLATSHETEPLSVLAGTVGSAGVARSLRAALHVKFAAVVTIDLADVVALSDTLGPVQITLRAESRDTTTGFSSEAGDLSLRGLSAVAYLRSRSMEERHGDTWEPSGEGDVARSERLITFLQAAHRRHAASSSSGRLHIALTAMMRSSISIHDLTATGRLLSSARQASRWSIASLPVVPEREVEHRRSPFDPTAGDGPTNVVLDRGNERLPAVCDTMRIVP